MSPFLQELPLTCLYIPSYHIPGEEGKKKKRVSQGAMLRAYNFSTWEVEMVSQNFFQFIIAYVYAIKFSYIPSIV